MKQKCQSIIVDNSKTSHRNSNDHDHTMMKTQIFNEELRDIVFAVSALTLEDDYSLIPYIKTKHTRNKTHFLEV